MAKPKNDLPRPRPWPALGKSVTCRVVTANYEFDMQIPVNDKTRKAQSGIFTLETLNGAKIRANK